MLTRTRIIALVAILLVAAGTAAYLLTRGPSDEEKAAEAAAAAQARGESCERAVEDALDVLRETDATLNANGYYLAEYDEQVADINYEVASVSYYDDALCEDAVGEHLEAAAAAYASAEDHWFNNATLQADWIEASDELRNAEDALQAIYDGETTTPDDDDTTGALPADQGSV